MNFISHFDIIYLKLCWTRQIQFHLQFLIVCTLWLRLWLHCLFLLRHCKLEAWLQMLGHTFALDWYMPDQWHCLWNACCYSRHSFILLFILFYFYLFIFFKNADFSIEFNYFSHYFNTLEWNAGSRNASSSLCAKRMNV